MRIEILVAEIGSTTTVVNGFNGFSQGKPVFLGQGQAFTTVEDGDVTLGLRSAMEDLGRKLKTDTLTYGEFFATSSAAGGLKMTVHGLVHDMTVKAAKEAALGAGAVLRNVTAGRLRASDLRRIQEIQPNIIMIAGGLDYGERETALENAEKIRSLNLPIPVIYAGNVENQEEILEIFKGYPGQVYLADNVYPKVDVLHVEPARRIIQAVFEEHIIKAPGMAKVHDLVNRPILPTPGAVMEAAMLLEEAIGDLVVLDVGGATTDVHSVTQGSEEINRVLLAPEPEAKRTVEGDLGVYVNRGNLLDRMGVDRLSRELGADAALLSRTMEAIPATEAERQLVLRLTEEAVMTSLERHAGAVRNLYGESGGRKKVAEGKDLTEVRSIIGTGGALTRIPGARAILERIPEHGRGNRLFPGSEAQVYLDAEYLFASLGVLSLRYPKEALALMQWSMGLTP